MSSRADSSANGIAWASPYPIERKSMYGVIKRLLDVVLALAVLVGFAPLWIVVALAIRVSSAGPALYRQRRVVGRYGREFTVYKFRTMYHDSDRSEHERAVARFVGGQEVSSEESDEGRWPVYKLVSDPRVTKLGRILRRYSIDEIPQLINVLRGEMSLVGPRPPIYYEYEHYSDRQRQRLSVPPGITGLYQITGRSRVPFDRMLEIDLDYIARRSLWLDLRIILKTPWVMITGKGAY